MAIQILHRIQSVTSQGIKTQSRSLFYWLTYVFNSVDRDRIKEVGPDVACAEWLLKNGAHVKWKHSPHIVDSYNSLPTVGGQVQLESVEAFNAGITYVGFPYFEGCKHVRNITFDSCKYIDDRAISLLSIVKDSLKNLKIINCKPVSEIGLLTIQELINLETLHVSKLKYVRNPNTVKEELQKALPKCQIEFAEM